MFKILLALAPVAIILLLSEFLWRKKIVKGERARKFIHILAGTWMAFWPQYLSFRSIIILGSFAIVLLIISRLMHLFHAIYAVKRRTYGDVLFAVAIVLCGLAGQEQWVFSVSILLMALADGGAAVVGRFWGIYNQYFVFGLHSLRKSVAGTLAFIVFAYISIVIGWFLGGDEVIRGNLVVVLLLLPFGAALIENITPFGLDNLFTPLFATLLLNTLL
jgi:dolichol kinase